MEIQLYLRSITFQENMRYEKNYIPVDITDFYFLTNYRIRGIGTDELFDDVMIMIHKITGIYMSVYVWDNNLISYVNICDRNGQVSSKYEKLIRSML